MDQKTLIFSSATRIVNAIKQREVTVETIVRTFLEHITKHNKKINAICALRDEEAIIKEARKKDEAIANGIKTGPLYGLPITIKDSFMVKGLVNSNGDPMQRKQIANADAELVKRLKSAGAIILGKTNTALYCIDWQSRNFWNGQTNNPYNLSRVAGGSSGGSAAAVASGMVPVELGSDAGGSIRVPAHFNGICGLRPTETYLSNRGHVKANGKPQGRRHVITPGPFAKNVEDLQLLMTVLGNNTAHALPEEAPLNFYHSSWDKAPLKIAYSQTISGASVDQEYLEIFNDFIGKIQSTEHNLVEAHPQYNEKEAYVEYNKVVSFETGVNNPKIPLQATLMYAFILGKYRDHLWAKGMAKGQRLSNVQYAKSIDYKDQFSGIFQDFLTTYDLWINPVCAFEAYPHQKAGKPFIINGKKVPYTKAMAPFVFNTAFSGHPIATIPIGFKKNGLPVGVQLHARKWNDGKLLDIAAYLQSLTQGFIPPQLTFE